MCGVAGYLSPGHGLSQARFDLSAALVSLEHRGPDGSGSWFGPVSRGEVGLGHTRLSIIDLSEDSAQPMVSGDGNLVLIFNGEIYNYLELKDLLEKEGCRFESHGDSEVLLQAWARYGKACLPMLKGMFAFALYDIRAQTLFLSRDRFGMKPLYFSLAGGLFRFASEPAVLARMVGRAEINHQKAYEYLALGLYDTSQETFFNDVFALPPGKTVEVRSKRDAVEVIEERWHKTSPPEEIDVGLDEAAETVRELFLNSILLHLRSDVPIAVALSGGLDSTGIVGAVRHLQPDREIHSFSYVSPGFAKDESEWAALASAHLGTEHHSLTLSPSDAVEAFDASARSQGEPTGSSSILAQSAVYRRVSAAGFRVLLDGQGADELFAGYHGFIEFRLRTLLGKGDVAAALRLVHQWQAKRRGNNMRDLIPSFAATYVPRRLAAAGSWLIGRRVTPPWIDPSQLAKSGVIPGVPIIAGYPILPVEQPPFLQGHLGKSLFRGDLVRLLRHGDRSSMGSSVESRLPYLDADLVNYVQSLPESLLLSPRGETKNVLRHALHGIVPEEIAFRQDKIGFDTPEDSWSSGFQEMLEFSSDGLARFDWIDAPKLLAQSTHGRKTFSVSARLAWRALSLSRWALQLG